MNPSSDKRATPRTDLHQVVRFQRTAVEGGRPWQDPAQGLGRDISPRGMSLLTDCFLRPGEILRLHVPLEANRSSVPVISEVRWVWQMREGFRIGLQFLA